MKNHPVVSSVQGSLSIRPEDPVSIVETPCAGPQARRVTPMWRHSSAGFVRDSAPARRVTHAQCQEGATLPICHLCQPTTALETM